MLRALLWRQGRIVAHLDGAYLPALQGRVDELWPWTATDRVDVRSDTTSDGTYQGDGKGTLRAERVRGRWSVLY